jgi:hypothetical protein
MQLVYRYTWVPTQASVQKQGRDAKKKKKKKVWSSAPSNKGADSPSASGSDDDSDGSDGDDNSGSDSEVGLVRVDFQFTHT